MRALVVIGAIGVTCAVAIAVWLTVADSQLHVTTKADGVVRMRPLAKGLKIDADASAILAHGSVHIMFTQLKVRLIVGQLIPAVLVFQRAGRVAVDFKVEPMGFAPSEDLATQHSGH